MTKTRLLLLILCCLIGFAFAAHARQGETPKPVVVMIDHDTSGFVYKINSPPVPVNKGLLYTLTFIKAPHSGSVLLVHEDAKISMLTDVLGIMNKAGYVGPRIFYFSRGKDRMAELTLSRVVPFSANGEIPDDNH